jgi:hypothetical protein
MYPQRRPDVSSNLLPDGHVVIFCVKTEWAQTLNPTAAIVWEFCDGEHTVADIAQELATLLGSEGTELGDDVSKLVAELGEAGLLIDKPKE